MGVVVINPPAAAIVTLATVKGHLRVDHNDDDALIGVYVAAATATIDGPDGWLGRALGLQTLELHTRWPTHSWRCGITLPCRPITEVVSVKYDDADDAEQTVDPADYALRSRGLLELAAGASWPSTRDGADAVRIRYIAGYAIVPGPIVMAVLLMVGDLYANRESVVVGAGAAAVPMTTTVMNLLSPFRLDQI